MGDSFSCGGLRRRLFSVLTKQVKNCDVNMSRNHQTENPPDNERRKRVRYAVAGSVRFQWQSADCQWVDAVGTALDMGNAGVFVESASIPPLSSALRLIVSLPTGWSNNPVLQLRGSGYVRHVRREPGQPSGFGASAVFQVEELTPKA
jgi:hypothetical protein